MRARWAAARTGTAARAAGLVTAGLVAAGVVVGLVAAGAVASSGAARAATGATDDPTPPGRHDLVLRVDRLERDEQADAVGSARSAMLFAPDDTAAIAAAARARDDARVTGTAGLFLSGAVPYREPRTAASLFADRAAAEAGTVRRAGGTSPAAARPGSSAQRGVPAPAAGGIGALVVAGGLASWRFGAGAGQGGRPW